MAPLSLYTDFESSKHVKLSYQPWGSFLDFAEANTAYANVGVFALPFQCILFHFFSFLSALAKTSHVEY